MDRDHPAHDSIADGPYRNVIEDLYLEADEIVGETMERIGNNTTVIVMSDHGFASWRRAFNLNTWLKESGYLALKDPSRQGESEFFANVDWSRTQAYALGLNGLYINLQGRERFGVVPRGQRSLIIGEIARGLLRVADPQTGELAIANVYRRDQIYESAVGRIPHGIFYDNTSKWSATHEIDREAVPGVLFASHPLRREVASLRDVAAAVLAEFDIEGFPRGDDAASAAK